MTSPIVLEGMGNDFRYKRYRAYFYMSCSDKLITYLCLGGDEGETAHAPCVRRGGVNGYSHLLNGFAEACPQPPRVGDASVSDRSVSLSVMLNEDMGSSGNHFGSSLVTSTFAAAHYRKKVHTV